MLPKAALGLLLASTPFCLIAAVQSPATDSDVPAGAGAPAPSEAAVLAARLRAERAHLQTVIAALRKQLDNSNERVAALETELNESLDLLQQTWLRPARRNCSPSRSRQLLSQYQWLDRRGHPERAKLALDHILQGHESNVSSMNHLAWSLMTDKTTTGQFDQLALAIAQRMQQRGKLKHHYADTVALANFLNGNIDAAIALQRQAIQQNDSDDYRRRLRTYEAAKRCTTPAGEPGSNPRDLINVDEE